MNDSAPLPQLQSASPRDDAYWGHFHEQLIDHLANPRPESAELFARAASELRSLPEEEASQPIAECLTEVAADKYSRGSSRDGIADIDRAVRIGRIIGHLPTLLRALCIASALKQDVGDLQSALRDLAEAVETVRSLHSMHAEARVWNSIGCLLSGVGQLDAAEKCCRRAAAICEEHGSPESPFDDLGVNVMSNLATLAMTNGQYEAALTAAAKAIARNPSPRGVLIIDRVNAETTAARAALKLGDRQLAERYAASARQICDAAPSTPRNEYPVALCEGLIAAHSSAPEIGLQRLRDAVETAREALPSELGDALSVCIEGHEEAGQTDVALVYMHELLALNRERKTEQLLAQVRELSACLGSPLALQTDQRAATDRAVGLESGLRKALDDVGTAAIIAAEQAGYDPFRTFRVARLAELFAVAEGWTPDRVAALALAAQLCDIGMGVIPSNILRKPRGLSAVERKIVEEHTHFGPELLTRTHLAVLQPCVAVAKFHHERWDGNGPWGLAGKEVPVEARLVALCDAFDALTHARPWRPAMSVQNGLHTIADEAGTRFDPELAQRFIACVQQEFWQCGEWEEHLSAQAHENVYVKARAQIDRLLES